MSTLSIPKIEVIHGLEKRMNNCFHCGTILKMWEPQIGVGPQRLKTSFRWCPNCCWVVFKTLATILNVPEQEIEEYLKCQH